MTLFYRIAEEEKNYAGTRFLCVIGSQEINKNNFPSEGKRKSILWNCIMRGALFIPRSLRLS